MVEYSPARFLRLYILPFLLFSGFFFNILSILVIRRMRKSATSKYMSILGVVDSGILVVGGISLWIHTFDSKFSIYFMSSLSCKLVPFFLYSFMDMSVFIIVVMTYKRFYAVCRPLQARVEISRLHASEKNKKKRIEYLDLIIGFGLCLLINSHFVYTHSVRNGEPLFKDYENFEFNQSLFKHGFQIDTEIKNSIEDLFKHQSVEMERKGRESELICIEIIWPEFYEKYWIYIDATIYSFFPSILLMIFNISIIRSLFQPTADTRLLKQSKKYFNSRKSLGSTHDTIKLVLVRYPVREMDKNDQINFPLKCQRQKSNVSRKFDSEDLNNVELYKEKNQFDLETEKSSAILFKQKSNRLRVNKTTHFHSSNIRITIMLIGLNVSFCLFSMPVVILQIYYYTTISDINRSLKKLSNYTLESLSWTFSTSILSSSTKPNTVDISIGSNYYSDTIDRIELLQAIAELLQFLNHSSNFFLYSFTGKAFRIACKRLFMNYYRSLKNCFCREKNNKTKFQKEFG